MTKGFVNLNNGLVAALALACLLAMTTAKAQSEFEFPADTTIDEVDDTANGTSPGWTHNGNELWAGVLLGTDYVGYWDSTGTPSWKTANDKDGNGAGLGSTYDLGNLTINITHTYGAPPPYSIAAVATDDYDGKFLNLGNIYLDGAEPPDSYGENTAYGFLSVGYDAVTSTINNAFTGTIEGSNVEVYGKGELIGVYFKGGFAAFTGKQDIGAGARITFGDINVVTGSTDDTTDIAGAAGFAAGAVLDDAEITLGNVEAYASDTHWATGVEFRGNVEGTVTITSLTADAANYAQGLIIYGNVDGANITIGETGLVDAIDVTARTSAIGIDILGAMTSGTISVTGDIKATGTTGQAAGIQVGSMTGGTITVTGDINAEGTAFAAGFSSNGSVDGSLTFDGIEATASAGQAAGINIMNGVLAATVLVRDDILVTAAVGAGISVGTTTGSITGNVTTQDINVLAAHAFGLWNVGDVTGNISLGAITLGEESGPTKVVQGAGIGVGGNFNGQLKVGDINVYGGTITGVHSLSGISIGGDFILDDGSSIGAIDVDASADDNVYGIVVGGDAEFTLTNNISAKNTGAGNAIGIHLYGATAESTITVHGNITVEGDATTGFGNAINVANNLNLALASASVLTLDGTTHVGGALNVTGSGEIITTYLNVEGNMTLGSMTSGSEIKISSETNLELNAAILNIGEDVEISSGGDMDFYADVINVGANASITSGGNLNFQESTITIGVGSTASVISAAGVIDFNDSTLIFDILKYSGDVEFTIISAGTLNNVGGIYITIAGEEIGDVNYLSATYDAVTVHGEITLKTYLSWNLGDAAAHGTFTLGSGAEFAVDSVLADKAPNPVLGWDGVSLTKEGAGRLILEANNTYTGNTTIVAGELIVTGTLGNGNYAGVITNDGELVFDQSANQTLSGGISGTGSLTKSGNGTLTLMGTNTADGGTTVLGGALLVNGSLTSAVTVQGGTLGGTGIINGLITVEDGGTLSPGNSIGTLDATAGITFKEGSTYLFEIDKTGHANDCLVVSNGTVTIEEGAVLNIVFLSGAGANDDKFHVIDADAVQFATGELFTLPVTWTGRFDQEIRSDGYWITWISTPADFAGLISGIGSPNAINAAAGMDKLVATGQTANISNLYTALNALPTEQALADAFAQLHGEVFATSKEAAVQMQRRFQSLLPNGRDFYKTTALPKEWNRWGTFTGDYHNRKKIGQYSGYEAASAGLALGVDKAISSVGLVGVAIGYDYMDLDLRTLRSKAEVEAFRVMLYNSWFNGDYYCDTYLGYTKNWYSTNRQIDFTGFSDRTKSNFDDDMGSLGIEVGRAWELGWGMLTPSIGLHYNFLSSPTVQEKGGEARLRVSSGDYHSVRLPIGVKLSKMFPWDHGSAWMPELRAHYIPELANDTVKVRTAFAGEPGVDFAATSGVRGRNNVRVGLGVGLLVANRVNFRLDYDCDIYDDTTADSFGVTLGVSW